MRTLHRYFSALDEMGIPIYAERGPYGGFSLVRGYKMPPLVFTPEEAAAVSLGTGLVEDLWGDLYRQAAHAALAKLENLLPEQQREEVGWARRALVTTGLVSPRSGCPGCHPGKPASAPSGNSHRVQHALPERLPARAGNPPAGSVCAGLPLGLVVRGRVLPYPPRSAYFPPGPYPGTDRVASRPSSRRPASMPVLSWKAPPAASHRCRSGSSSPRESAQAARLNRLFWSEIEEQPDGSLLVTFPAPDLNWAASTILAYGPVVEVLDPPELRQLVHAWAQAIVNLNGLSTDQ